MSDELEYNFQKVNEGETLDRYGFMIGAVAIRLDETREPNPTHEPMRTRAQQRPVQKAREPLDIDLSELEAWLSGEPDPGPAEPEPEPEPEPTLYPGVPLPVVELDRRPNFVDLVRAQHNRQDVVQRPEPNSFIGFLQRHYQAERDRLKDMIDGVSDDI